MSAKQAPELKADYFDVRLTQQELSLDHGLDATAGHCLVPCTLTLMAHGEEDFDAAPVEVATLEYFLLSANDGWSSQDYFEALDSVDSDVAEFMNVLTDGDGEINLYPESLLEELGAVNLGGPIALLNTLVVAEQWRGRGLGLALLAHALRYQLGGCPFAVMSAWPMQYGRSRPDGEDELKEWLDEKGYAGLPGSMEQAAGKLASLYESLGFKKLSQPSEGRWMILSFAYNHEEEWAKAIAAAH